MTRSGVGVVVALAAEARALAPARPRLGQIEDLGGGVRRHVCGMGPEAAAAAAAELVRSGVAALAMFGVAGALDPLLASGAVLCPAEVLDDAGRRYACDGAWRSRLAIRLGSLVELRDAPLLTVREPLLTPQAKAEAYRRSAAAAVDMESAAVAAAAHDAGLPFLALRAIADGAADSLPPALTGAVDRWGRPKPLGVAGALLGHPQLIARLPHLAATMNLATAALRRVAQNAGHGLAFSE
jgi:adenosylhomocysteine nucleosidase